MQAVVEKLSRDVIKHLNAVCFCDVFLLLFLIALLEHVFLLIKAKKITVSIMQNKSEIISIPLLDETGKTSVNNMKQNFKNDKVFIYDISNTKLYFYNYAY